MPLFDKQTRTVSILIYKVRNTSPPRFAIYDAIDADNARKRIEEKHSEYIYLGKEIMTGGEDAKNMSRGFNQAMALYQDLLKQFPDTNDKVS
jgi:hypothetical protein